MAGRNELLIRQRPYSGIVLRVEHPCHLGYCSSFCSTRPLNILGGTNTDVARDRSGLTPNRPVGQRTIREQKFQISGSSGGREWGGVVPGWGIVWVRRLTQMEWSIQKSNSRSRASGLV